MDNNPLVYSTSQGRICPDCNRPINDCVCKVLKQQVPDKNLPIRIWLDRKGRGGKLVTRIEGLVMSAESLKALTREIKQKCGAGGAIKDFTIEIQGDVRDQVLEMLLKKGMSAKKAGG